jgi:DNA-directed RNA polymerase subunit N
MIIPVRCWSCGKPIGHLWEEFLTKTNNRTMSVKEILDNLGIERYCCRAQFMGHVDLMDTVSQFKKF